MKYVDGTAQKNQRSLMAAILLISCCLRAPITGVGPMIGIIRDDLNLANSAAGMLTTIPLLAFAVVSLFVGKLSSRFRAGDVMLWGLAASGIGILCRSYLGMGGLFVGTIIIGIGIAVGNVLIPAFIKAYFPGKTGMMTGVYTSLMAIFSGIAGAVSIPMYALWGWKNALFVWIFLFAAAILLWLPSRTCVLEGKHPERLSCEQDTDEKALAKRLHKELAEAEQGADSGLQPQPRAGSKQLEADAKGSGLLTLARDSMTWWVSAYMGIQSLTFYCFVAWFATIVQSKGFDAQTAGYFNSAYMLIGIPGSLILPMISDRCKNQSALAVGLGILYMGGMTAMILAKSTSLLIGSMLCCGFCAGASLSFAMLLFSMHTSNAADASTLSGLAQSIGYTLAAAGPVCMGQLYDVTGGWTIPLVVVLIMVGAMTVAGLFSGREGIIGEKE